MDEWTPPPSAKSTDYPGQPRDGIYALVGMVRDNATEMRDRFNGLLKQSGVKSTPAGLIFEKDLKIEGTLTADHVIDNSALASPVVPAAFSNTATGFDPQTGAWATVASVTLTVPDGLTQAVVTASCYVAIVNTTPSTSTQIHSRVLIDTEAGPVDDEWSDANRRDTGGNTYSTALTGLTPGGSFVVACQAYAGADFTAHANNKAVISGTVLWLR